ncbi:4'-phosphopantetheinyl transferase superfamily protein [uncultured Fibrobacter sp.]|uniref:4'-phosphopantetheinyl transferase family protein n=1 Tax=uncultured Fibrobacter sp. TaxID=261512 RepID=UPI0025FD322B|nr:4'-phosphopantetheinyl transferase superfamily protein [uncultured Fibrobacter sp.]MBR3668675.1 4'-phosphopantetheinyl transferase superfamily protein [Fibrobacter sp.]
MISPTTKILTPCGEVFITLFPKAGKLGHRERIFRILSNACGKTVSEGDMVVNADYPRPFFPEQDFDANWTHSGDICALAYSFDAMVGLDLEFFRRNRQSLAERFFCEEEVQHLRNVPQFDKEFFRLWCRKEAYYKCHGGDFFAGSLRRSMLPDVIDSVYLQDLHAPRLAPELIGTEDVAMCLAVELA